MITVEKRVDTRTLHLFCSSGKTILSKGGGQGGMGGGGGGGKEQEFFGSYIRGLMPNYKDLTVQGEVGGNPPSTTLEGGTGGKGCLGSSIEGTSAKHQAKEVLHHR